MVLVTHADFFMLELLPYFNNPTHALAELSFSQDY